MGKFAYSKHYKSILNIIPLLLLLLIIYSCFLDRSVVRIPERSASNWVAKSTPGVICPIDEVTISWDVGSVDCGDSSTRSECVDFVCSSFVDGTELFRNGQRSGFRILRDIDASTIFTYSVIARDLDVRPVAWERKSDQVVVIPTDSISPFPPTHTVYWEFQAQCVRDTSSTIPTFKYDVTDYRLNTGSPDFIELTKGWGECVRIVEICHTRADDNTRYPIEIMTLDGSLPPTSIDVGACLSGINLQTGLEYLVHVDNPSSLVGICSAEPETGGSPTVPPTLTLEFSLGCDSILDECR